LLSAVIYVLNAYTDRLPTISVLIIVRQFQRTINGNVKFK